MFNNVVVCAVLYRPCKSQNCLSTSAASQLPHQMMKQLRRPSFLGMCQELQATSTHFLDRQ